MHIHIHATTTMAAAMVVATHSQKPTATHLIADEKIAPTIALFVSLLSSFREFFFCLYILIKLSFSN